MSFLSRYSPQEISNKKAQLRAMLDDGKVHTNMELREKLKWDTDTYWAISSELKLEGKADRVINVRGGGLQKPV